MPTITRLYLKSSLLFLLGALGCATAMALFELGQLGPTYLHLFAVGWITQMIFGVALWLFPARSRAERGKSAPSDYVAFGALNVGLVLRAVAEPLLLSGTSSPVLSAALVASAVLQWLSGVIFAVRIWPRIRVK